MRIERLNEMAYDRSQAVKKCYPLGKQFISHFHKCMDDIYQENNKRLHHHTSEMQAWWDEVKEIKLTYNNKSLSADQLINWFFTAGSDIETVIQDEYTEVYENLIISLLKDRNSDIYNIFINMRK